MYVIPASSKGGLMFAFCPRNGFCKKAGFSGRPEFLLIYWCQTSVSAAKIPDQTAKIPDQTAKIPDHAGWQFLKTAFVIFRKDLFPQEQRRIFVRCFWATGGSRIHNLRQPPNRQVRTWQMGQDHWFHILQKIWRSSLELIYLCMCIYSCIYLHNYVFA